MIKITVNDEKFDVKPLGNEIGRITNAMNEKRVTVEDFLQCIMNGQTVRCGNGGSKELEWKSQQVFMIDIDDGLTINEAIEKYSFLSPSFIYTSFSHSDEHHKFRLVFIVDDLIKDFDKAKETQLKLMQSISECDEKCKNLNRLYFGGKDCVYKNLSNRLNVDYLNSISLEKEVRSVNENKNNDSIKTRTISNILLYIKDKVHVSEAKEYSVIDYYDEIYKYDMYDILKLLDINVDKNSETFSCILPNHNDKNPSAGIIISDDGHYIYNCFGCGKKLNNITLIEDLYGLSRYEALNILNALLGIKKADSDFVKRQKDKINVNIEYIITGQLQRDFPEIYKFIKRDLNKLVLLYEFAKMNIYSDKYQTKDDKAIFYASTDVLKDVFNTNSKDTANKTIQMFNILSLINKMSPNSLPDDVLEIAKKHSKKGKITNHYNIEIFSNNFLNSISDTVGILKENKFTKHGLSKEYIIRTFGQERADELYPQHDKMRTTKQSDNLSIIVSKIINDLIESKGYAGENNIIDEIRTNYAITKGIIIKQLKRSCKEICDSYGLDYVNCTKENKIKYNLPQELHHAKKVYCKVK